MVARGTEHTTPRAQCAHCAAATVAATLTVFYPFPLCFLLLLLCCHCPQVVLYELMSLKHPFDATSMEGLLNKIVKSQPPPLPKHYSIELRTVVDSLLSKQPAKRPNVNALLKLPFLAAYVSRASLSQEQLADEFSHTVIHSDASARGAGGGALAMPQSNQVQHRGSHQPQQGIPRAKQREHAPPLHPQSQQRYPAINQHQQQQQNGWEEHKEAAAQPLRSASPYRQQFSNNAAAAASPASHYPPPTGRNSARSVAPVYGSSRDGPQVPPSPYAGLSNADAIRMIREKKEHELREARAAQLEQQRRREAAEASVAAAASFASPAETERDRQLRAREREKERAMVHAQQQQQAYGNLPPMLRHQQQQQYVNLQAQAQVQAILHGGADPGRGIPAVPRHPHHVEAATPLHGAPYNPRLAGGGAAAPTRLQQQQLAAAEAARRVREDEMSRMRVNYFRERKQKRESKLAAINRGGALQQPQAPGPRALPPPSSYPPQQPSHQRLASRPPSSDRYGPGHAMGAPPPTYGRRAGSQEPARWR